MTSTPPGQMRLTPFEQLMLHKDSAAFPSNCFVRLKFCGRLDRNTLLAAAHLVVGRHPLLHSTVRTTWRGYFWQTESINPRIDWTEDPQPPGQIVPRFDLHAEPGLRILVHVQEATSDVTIQFHHSCCDGCGIAQVARELMIAYAGIWTRSPESDWKLPSLDNDLLKTRGTIAPTWSGLLGVLSDQLIACAGIWQYLSRTPQAILPHEPAQLRCPVDRDYPGMIAHHFDREFTKEFRAALVGGMTSNDILTRDLFQALDDFRCSAGGEKDGWIRLMVPVNLRSRAQYAAPAANLVSSIFFDRRGEVLHDPAELLETVSREMGLIKRKRLWYTFALSLMAQRLIPGGMRKAARPDRCMATAVFTNLGKVFSRCPLPRDDDGRWRCGNATLLHTEWSGPLARKVSASFSVSWYAGRMSVTLHYDPGVLTADAGQQLLSLFVQRIGGSKASS